MVQTIQISARIEEMNKVTEFVSDILEKYDCSPKSQIQLEVAIDEILSNIVHYAYGEQTGIVTVECDIQEGKAQLCFIDSGVPYNPLVKEDPDVSLSVNERAIGGLGIFMVKKSMDDMQYEYKDNCNRLTIVKTIA